MSRCARATREGFKAPTLFQLSDTAGATAIPICSPKRARAYEVGVRIQAAPLAFIDIRLVPPRHAQSCRFRELPHRSQSPAPHLRDGQRSFSTPRQYQPRARPGSGRGRGAAFSPGLRFSANYSLVVATDRTPGSVYAGNRLARRPKHLANAELGWTPGGAFAGADLSVAARYAGKSFDDRANNVTLDDYWLVDLRASYPLAAGIDVYGRIENLFDTDYQTVAGYGTAGARPMSGSAGPSDARGSGPRVRRPSRPASRAPLPVRHGIVSIDYCADQMLLGLVPQGASAPYPPRRRATAPLPRRAPRVCRELRPQAGRILRCCAPRWSCAPMAAARAPTASSKRWG